MLSPHDTNIRVCHRCYFASFPCHGACLCGASARDISEHAHSGECPMGLFADAQKRKRFTRTARATAMSAMLAEALKLEPTLDVTAWKIEHGLLAKPPTVHPPPPVDSLCVVRLDSCGDLLVILPALKHHFKQGRTVTLIVREKYLPIVEKIPWLNVIAVPNSTNAHQAMRDYAHVAETMINATFGANDTPFLRTMYNSWCMIAWRRMRMPDELFNRLPLELENRDHAAEAEIIRRYRRRPWLPLMLVSLTGFSSKFRDGDEFRAKLREWHGERFEIVDLSFIHARRINDLLGLYERAACLIASDSGPLHLGYAVCIPTVAFVNNGDKTRRTPASSHPRPHWICRLRYENVLKEEGLDLIRNRIDGLFSEAKKCGLRTSARAASETSSPAISWNAASEPTPASMLSLA